MTDRPLAVRAELGLTEAQHTALRRLAAVDLSPLRDVLLRDAVLPEEWVDDAIVEFRRFLALHVLTDPAPAMVSSVVDEVWRTCRASSSLYAQLCAALGSTPRHDTPGGWPDYRLFAQAYVQAFGPLTRMWKFPVLWWDPSCAHLFRSSPRRGEGRDFPPSPITPAVPHSPHRSTAVGGPDRKEQIIVSTEELPATAHAAPVTTIDAPHRTSGDIPPPTAEIRRVAVEFAPATAEQVADLQRRPGANPSAVREAVAAESRVLDYLASNPGARSTMITNPLAVLHDALPTVPPALLAAATESQRTAPKLPEGLRPEGIEFGIVDRAPLRPVERTALPRLAAGSLAGFDAAFAVSAGALGRLLAEVLGPLLSSVSLASLPVIDTAVLAVREVTAGPTAVIDAGNRRARLVLTGSAELTVPPLALTVPGLQVRITLDVTARRNGGLVELNQVGVGIELLGLSADAIPGIGSLLSTLLGTIVQTVTTVIRGAFPRTAPVSLPGGNPNFCDIGLRNLAVGFLPGRQGQTDPCLAVLTNLLPGAQGNIASLTSPLPVGADAGLFLDNFFLLTEIACEVQHAPQLAGLPAPTHRPRRNDQNPFFAWTDLDIEQEINGETIVIRKITVEIDATTPAAKAFVISAELTIKRSLFQADVSLSVPVTLKLNNGEITPVVGVPTYDVKVRLTALGIFLGIVVGVALIAVGVIVGAIIAGIVGAIVGGIAGAGVLAVVVLIVVSAIKKAVGTAIKDAVAGQAPSPVQVIPKIVLDTFGTINVLDLVFDDLALVGTLRPPPTAPALSLSGPHAVGTPQTRPAPGQPGVQHVSRTVRFAALPQRMRPPVQYEWRWGSTVLRTGHPPAGTGISAVTVENSQLRITNAFGSDVNGTVTARATDAAGTSLSRTAQLTLTGSVDLGDDLPPNKPDPQMPERP